MSERLRVAPRERTLAFYLDHLEGGGAQKSTIILAGALAARGHAVELLVCRPRGALHDQVSPEIEVVALDHSSVWSARMLALRSDPAHFGAILGGIALAPRPSSTLGYLGSLATVLGARRPYALYAANTHRNLEALFARRLARSRHAYRRHGAECVPRRPSPARLVRAVPAGPGPAHVRAG